MSEGGKGDDRAPVVKPMQTSSLAAQSSELNDADTKVEGKNTEYCYHCDGHEGSLLSHYSREGEALLQSRKGKITHCRYKGIVKTALFQQSI